MGDGDDECRAFRAMAFGRQLVEVQVVTLGCQKSLDFSLSYSSAFGTFWNGGSST